jgi:hypothetical protein
MCMTILYAQPNIESHLPQRIDSPKKPNHPYSSNHADDVEVEEWCSQRHQRRRYNQYVQNIPTCKTKHHEIVPNLKDKETRWGQPLFKKGRNQCAVAFRARSKAKRSVNVRLTWNMIITHKTETLNRKLNFQEMTKSPYPNQPIFLDDFWPAIQVTQIRITDWKVQTSR